MAAPSDSVFIGDLPPTVDDATIQTVFGSYGTIKSFKVLPPSVRGQGNAIVSFASVEEATWIVNNLSGNIPQGLSGPVTVNFKQAKKPSMDVMGMGGGMGMGGMGGMGGKGGMSLTPPAGAAWGGAAAGGGMGGMGGGCGGAIMDSGMGGGPAVPSTSLFLGDLPADMDDQGLQTIFGAYGNIVSATMLQPGTSGKRAAIATFDTLPTAQWIVDNLHGNIPQGLTEPIVARYKNQGPKPMGGAPGGAPGGGFGGSFGGPPSGGGAWGAAPPSGGFGGGKSGGDPTTTLFVGDLPVGIDDATLSAVFGAYGTISSVKILPPGTTGAAALVNMSDPAEAKWCVENLNEQIPQGLTAPVKCRFKTPKPDGMAWAGGKGWGASPY